MRRHHEQNTAVRDQFGKQAAAYARIADGKRNLMRDALFAAVKPSAIDRVLDVGCGPGRLTLDLAPHVAHITGIDLTPEMLSQAAALQAERKISNVTWQQGDVLHMPFENGAFTVVVTQATFHHLIDPAAILAEMTRVCAPGGRIMVNDLTPASAKSQAFDAWERLRDPSHVHALLCEELRGLGRRAGLREVTCLPHETVMPIEAILKTSFPLPGDMARVRALVRDDAASGADRLGMAAREESGQIMVSYPMTMMVWRRD